MTKSDDAVEQANELLPCPFCGHAPVFSFLLQKNSRRPDGFDTWALRCGYSGCLGGAGPTTGYQYTKAECARIWNTRAASIDRVAVEWEFKKVRKMVEDTIPEHHRTGGAGIVYAAMVKAMDAVIEGMEKKGDD